MDSLLDTPQPKQHSITAWSCTFRNCTTSTSQHIPEPIKQLIEDIKSFLLMNKTDQEIYNILTNNKINHPSGGKSPLQTIQKIIQKARN